MGTFFEAHYWTMFSVDAVLRNIAYIFFAIMLWKIWRAQPPQ